MKQLSANDFMCFLVVKGGLVVDSNWCLQQLIALHVMLRSQPWSKNFQPTLQRPAAWSEHGLQEDRNQLANKIARWFSCRVWLQAPMGQQIQLLPGHLKLDLAAVRDHFSNKATGIY